jgi:hypothetical protein
MTDILICYRVENVPGLPPVLSNIMTCDGCHKPIWVALSSPADVRRICLQCAAIRLKDVTLKDITAGMTLDQLRDLKDYFGT